MKNHPFRPLFGKKGVETTAKSPDISPSMPTQKPVREPEQLSQPSPASQILASQFPPPQLQASRIKTLGQLGILSANKKTLLLIAIIILVILIMAVFAYRQHQQQQSLLRLKRKLRKLM